MGRGDGRSIRRRSYGLLIEVKRLPIVRCGNLGN
jgi:hypothetical protein